MGCYWRNVSQSLRWGNVERCDPSPIKVEVLANRMEPGHFLSQSFQPTFVVLCLKFCINLAHSHVKKQRLILTLFVFFVKWLTLSFLCIMLAICKIFKLLWSHIVVTAAHSSWQLSLLPPSFFHQRMRFLTLHQCRNDTDVWQYFYTRILCVLGFIYVMRFFHLLPFGPNWWYYFMMYRELFL